jgi:hypothetical protein
VTAFLRLEAADGTGITLIDPAVPPGANPTTLVEPVDWGNAQWETQASGPRGTQGRRPGGSAVQDRRVSLPLRIYGSSKDNLTSRISALNVVVEAIRKNGGRITRRSHNQTYRQHLEVMSTPGLRITNWGAKAENRDAADVVIEAVCAPYALGDPMRVLDLFDTDSEGDYTFDAGAAGNVAVARGALTSVANPAVEQRMIHTARGYSYGDVRVALKFTPGATITSFKAGVVAKWSGVAGSGTNSFLEAYVDDNGTNSRLRVDKVVGGVRTNLGTTNLAARVVNGTSAWVSIRIEANYVFAEYFTTWRGLSTIPTSSVAVSLPAVSEESRFGRARAGLCGLSWTPQSAAAVIDDFEIAPFVYRIFPPVDLSMAGLIPGDVPALCAVRLAKTDDYPANADPRWLVAGWDLGTRIQSLVVQGDGGDATNLTPGWSGAVVTGVVENPSGASTISASTTASFAKFGTGSIRIDTLAAANSGGTYRIARRFRPGNRYVAMAWVAGSPATQARIRLGANGDIASDTPAALSATPVLRTCSWVPAAANGLDEGYFAVEVTAAAATSIYCDGVLVFESTPAGLSAAIADAAVEACSVDVVPSVWPPAPFVALVDTELVLVTRVAGTTLTIARGHLGTTAAAHSSGALVHALPPDPEPSGSYGGLGLGLLRPQDGWASANWPPSALILRDNSVSAAGEQYTATWTLSTVGIRPDEGQQTTDVEVFAKLGVGGALGQITTQLSAFMVGPPIFGFFTQGSSGPVSYPLETGNAARAIPAPAAADEFVTRVGTLRMPTGPQAQGFRVRLTLTVTVAAATNAQFLDLHYLMLVPSRRRIATPSGTGSVPLIFPSGGTNSEHLLREVAPDLSGRHLHPHLRPEVGMVAPGIGGSLIEMPSGLPLSLFVGLSAMVPDETAFTALDGSVLAAFVQILPTPRWAHLR